LFVLALLYVIQDIDDAVDANNAAIEVIYQATNMTVATASAWIMVVLVFFVNVSSWTTAGRITYALCRDGIFPYSDYLAHVDENTKAPIRSLVLFTLLAMALILLALVGSTEFYSMAGICTFAFQVSYSIPFIFKVFLLCPTAKVMLETSPINLGRWSFTVSVISMIWLLGTAVLMTFPTESPVTAENMNYTSVVAAGVVVLGILNWELNTKGTFKGPKRSDDDESSDEEGVPTGSKSIGSKSPKESDPLLDKERRALL
jgi:amino acid transporter